MFSHARPCAIAGLLLALGGCSGGSGDTASPVGIEDAGPIADAGPDQAAIRGDTITLDGTASSSDSTAGLAYSWTFEQIPLESGMDDTHFGSANGTPNASTIAFTPDVIGTYVIGLTVNDGAETSARDIVVVSITSSNLQPVADAGPDAAGRVGERISLDGSASFDPDGTLTEYSWTIASIPEGSALEPGDLYGSASAEAELLPDVAGIWVVGLSVYDGLAWSDPDYAALSVDTDNLAPVADAGQPVDLPPCNGEDIALDGAGSYDPEGASLQYTWSLLSAPDGSAATDADFTDASARKPHFSWDVPGEYVFTLQVSDGEVSSARDLVHVTVQDPATNRAPVADAGMAFEVDDDADCRNEAGTTVCDDCLDLDFELDGSASSDPDGDALTYRWTLTDGLEADLPDASWTTVDPPPLEAQTGAGNVQIVEATLEVADCEYISSHTIQVTMTCQGKQ